MSVDVIETHFYYYFAARPGIVIDPQSRVNILESKKRRRNLSRRDFFGIIFPRIYLAASP